ncbi:MAG: hypothetical protein O2992_06165 [Gemmatimonadetes bacterium]|jgi:hypothetical protein|nr:hypothetical protein [Gemmatimonadota bacterium]
MRTTFLTLLLIVAVAAPIQAQMCQTGPSPELSTLFPNEVAGLTREFYDSRDGCLTNLYRPASYRAAEGTTPAEWAVVSIEPHNDPFLGESAEAMKAHYERSGMVLHETSGWPVSFEEISAGHEFVALKGDLRIAVVIKGAANQASSWFLAKKFFDDVLPKVLVPCQS